MLASSLVLLSLVLLPFSAAHPTPNAHAARDLSHHAHVAALHAREPAAPVAAPPAVKARSSRKKGKRCAPDASSTTVTSSAASASPSLPPANIEAGPSSSAAPTKHKGHGGNGGSSAAPATSSPAPLMSTTSTAPAPPPTTSAASSGGGSGSSDSGSSGNLIQGPNVCGGPGATSDDPNGAEWWLNCGLSTTGWQPPNVAVSDLVYVDLQDALNSNSGVFSACSAYVSNFENWASQTGIPSIMLASFAMQESGCNPSAVGPNGEQGLMQLTVDKCGPAPGGNCQDIDFNIMTGAQYIATTISQAGGNVLLAVGLYNGWVAGQTIDSVISEANGDCGAMQNLDYLEQFFNYWLQNKNAYASSAGTIHNQALCQSGQLSQIETRK